MTYIIITAALGAAFIASCIWWAVRHRAEIQAQRREVKDICDDHERWVASMGNTAHCGDGRIPLGHNQKKD